MSHIVTIKTEIRDAGAVQSACQRLRLPQPVQGRHDVSGGEITGLGVQLPDWMYPVVCELNTGQLHYDNYEGDWGEQKHLDAFLQAYSVEKAKVEARRNGRICTEAQLSDGSIKLTISVGGAA